MLASPEVRLASPEVTLASPEVTLGSAEVTLALVGGHIGVGQRSHWRRPEVTVALAVGQDRWPEILPKQAGGT